MGFALRPHVRVRPGPAFGVLAGLMLGAVLLVGCADGSSGDTSGEGVGSSLGTHHVLPRLGFTRMPSEEGFGEVRPLVISYGGDPTSMISDVEWESWGDAVAIGHGTGSYLKDDQYTYQARPTPVTVYIWTLGTCFGHPSYLSIQWFFPTKGEVPPNVDEPGNPTCMREDGTPAGTTGMRSEQ